MEYNSPSLDFELLLAYVFFSRLDLSFENIFVWLAYPLAPLSQEHSLLAPRRMRGTWSRPLRPNMKLEAKPRTVQLRAVKPQTGYRHMNKKFRLVLGTTEIC